MTEDSFGDVCRLCLSKEGLMLPIFSDYVATDGMSFPLKIMSCASIEVFADDELPCKICHVCVHQVEKSFQFKTMCENSDALLRSKLKRSERETESKKEKFAQEDFLTENDELSFSQIPQCAACLATFSTYDDLTDHVAERHSDDADGLFCTACNVPTSCSAGFKTHVNLYHRFKCDRCGSIFKRRKNLRDHEENHFKEIRVCKFCKKHFQNFFELKKHELNHVEKTCRFCGKETDSEESWDSHLKICARSYGCKFCKTDFQLKKDLIAHVVQVHDEGTVVKKCLRCQNDLEEDAEDSLCKGCRTPAEEQTQDVLLSCRFCTKTFALKSSLRRHEKSHSGVKPYQCKFCPRKFKDNSTCIVHTRTHTGEHPFRCPECNKDFKQLANLKMHTYRHHKKNSETEPPYRDDAVSPEPRFGPSFHHSVSTGT